jgi:hypothetical protein
MKPGLVPLVTSLQGPNNPRSSTLHTHTSNARCRLDTCTVTVIPGLPAPALDMACLHYSLHTVWRVVDT